MPVRADDDHPVRVLAAVGEVAEEVLERGEPAVVEDPGPVEVLDGHEVDRLAVDGDPVHPRPAGDDLLAVGHAVAVLVLEEHDVADRAAGDVDAAVARDGHHARVDEVAREHAHLEPGREAEPGDPVRRGLELAGLDDVGDDLDVGVLGVLELVGRGLRLGRGAGRQREAGDEEGLPHGCGCGLLVS